MAESGAGLELFPVIGTYVGLSIDAEMTLEALNDEHVTEVTKKMLLQPKMFVGYVAGADHVINHNSEFQSFRVELLREGLTPRKEEMGIEPDMCTPVWPTTKHPSSRPPLRPDKPLPWSNCYHSSFDTIIVRVPTSYENAEMAVTLPISEMVRHNGLVSHDISRAAETRVLRQPTLPEERGQFGNNDDERLGFNGSQSSIPDDDLPQGEHDSLQSNRDFVQAIMNMAEVRPADTMITVEMTYDLSFVKTLTDPKEFYIEKKVLEKLEQDTKAAAIERARRLDEEAFGGAQTQSSAPEPTAGKDDTVTLPWLTRTRQRIASIFNSVLARFRRPKHPASNATLPP